METIADREWPVLRAADWIRSRGPPERESVQPFLAYAFVEAGKCIASTVERLVVLVCCKDKDIEGGGHECLR